MNGERWSMMFSRILDLNHLAVNPRYHAYEWRMLGPPLRRFVRNNLSIIYQTARHSWLSIKTGKRPQQGAGGVLFYANTLNQFRALRQVSERVERSFTAGHDAPVSIRFPMARFYWLTLISLPVGWLALLLNITRPRMRRALLYFFDGFVMAIPAYLVAKRWLAGLRPVAVVLSNDHTVLNRAVFRAAQSLGVTTFYLQHAPVADYFPPLEFDFALLDGAEALRKYESAGPVDSQVLLIGAVRLDREPVRRRAKQDFAKPVIGIATNELDNLRSLGPLVEALRLQWPRARFVVRPHPSDPRYATWRVETARLRADLSESRSESSPEFLAGVDVLLAGDTGIHLDAALSRVPSIMYPFSSPMRDYYGFGPAGLCAVVADVPSAVDAVRASLSSPSSNRMATKYYHEAFESGYEGRLAVVVGRIIECALKGEHALAQCPYIRRTGDHYRLAPEGEH